MPTTPERIVDRVKLLVETADFCSIQSVAARRVRLPLRSALLARLAAFARGHVARMADVKVSVD